MAVLKATARKRIGSAARRLGAVCLLGLAALGSARAAAPAPISPEYQLKAVVLFRFTQFVEWPPKAFATPDAPLVIGVVGEDPFGSYLDDVVKGEKLDSHPVVVRRFHDLAEITACQMLYISRSENARIDRIVDRVRGLGVLTVGDSDEFTRQGGMVRFVIERGKIRFRINVKATTAAGLPISSTVLSLATIVTADR